MRFPRRFTPKVTDHAVLRWIERVRGVDLALVREEILAQGREQWIAEGVASVKLPALRVVLVIREGVVITVRPIGGQVRR
jgi:hypothetical protein